eukprot:761211-Hanusia_phi.AAC.1
MSSLHSFFSPSVSSHSPSHTSRKSQTPRMHPFVHQLRGVQPVPGQSGDDLAKRMRGGGGEEYFHNQREEHEHDQNHQQEHEGGGAQNQEEEDGEGWEGTGDEDLEEEADQEGEEVNFNSTRMVHVAIANTSLTHADLEEGAPDSGQVHVVKLITAMCTSDLSSSSRATWSCVPRMGISCEEE